MRIIFSIITLLICALTADAQTFLGKLRQSEAGKGCVTVIQSAAIDSLVNGTLQQKKQATEPVRTQLVPPAQTKPQDNSPKDNKEHTTPAAPAKEQHVSPSADASDATTSTTIVDTRKKVMRNSYKTQGYRIQVFSGGNSRVDRQKAENAGTMMKANFPSEPIYVHFYSPSWKCRMGNYKTVEEARRILAQVKKLGYTQACIVKGTISVQY